MHKVAILTYNNASLFELGCAVELFGLKRPEFKEWYDCDVVTFEEGLLASTSNILIQAKKIETLAPYTTLIIPSWPTDARIVDKTLAIAITKFYRSGKRLFSFCSGAFLLAELGFLKGGRATTHWCYAKKFKERFPEVNYADDVLYVYDDTIACSAGSAAAIDLGIEIIRNDYGYKVANQVARRMVLSAHRDGGQSQFIETPMLEAPKQFSKALDWALNNLEIPININTFASKANMTRRTFDRKFKSSFNLTPKEWLTTQRIQRAKELLESKSLSIEQVAELAGFANAITMRHHFRKILGISPKRYQEKFSSMLVGSAGWQQS